MNPLYIVFECNHHRHYSTYVIKFITRSKRAAISLYHHTKKEWMGSDYYMNVAAYEPVLIPEGDNNIFDSFQIIKTTENEKS